MIRYVLIMRLDGMEIARKPFGSSDKLSDLITALKKEYKDQIEKAGVEPGFYLENVPSVISTFKSLQPDSVASDWKDAV